MKGNLALRGFEQSSSTAAKPAWTSASSLVPHAKTESPDDGHEWVSCLLTIT